MNSPDLIKKFITPLLLLLFTCSITFAQTNYSIKNNIRVSVSGTSSLHDWVMQSSKGTGTATFTFNTDGSIKSFATLSFTIATDNLKSDNSGLDKAAYKALKKDANSNISFVAATGTVSTTNGGNYIINCAGKLTIAGATKDIALSTTLKLNTDKSITVSGSKVINMKDFGIDPPTAMLGMIKAGKEVIIQFEVTLQK